MNVGVIIPTYNEEDFIEDCVNSVLSNNYTEGQINIYVCDGRSTDRTREIVKIISVEKNNVILLDNLAKTTPFALNLGLKKSNDDVKIILGAHSIVNKSFIKSNVDILNRFPEVGCSGGVLENVYENEIARQIGQAMSSKFGVGNALFRTGAKDGYVDTVAFGAYRKEIFETIGYFDTDLVRNQDDEFNHRLLKNGFKIYLSNNINSKYFVRGSFSKLWKQYFQYGYWKVFVNKKVKTVTTVRQLFPAILVTSIFLGLLLSLFFSILWPIWSIGLGSYIMLSMIFSLMKSDSIKDFFAISFSFYILHFSYGIGYLRGILDFLILKKNPSKNSGNITR